jgi:hypothetical protein
LVLAVGTALGQVQFVAGIQRLDNGNTVVTDAGGESSATARILEVDTAGQVVWAYLKSDIPWAHTARRLANGNTLITGTNANRVLEIDPVGDSVWAFSDSLDYPNDAYRLDNGNTLITDRDNNRVIEVTPDGTRVWSYNNLDGPHNGNRLANGNTLICDSNRNLVIEVDSAGETVWQYGVNLWWPRSAERLANGGTLIADSYNDRVIEVDSSQSVVWDYHVPGFPFMADRLANGNTLMSVQMRVLEVRPDSAIVWAWPGNDTVRVDTLHVVNPVSGGVITAHVHLPTHNVTTGSLPAVVLVPDGLYPGNVFDTSGLSDMIAADGFAALTFDPEGRGSSRQYPEDYDGAVHQAGLQACLDVLDTLSYVDTSRVGILSVGYGVTMAAGMLAHCPPSWPVKFLIDFEGPADRYETSSDSGGPVPVSPDSQSFWQYREASRDMSQISCRYLRIQTAKDHNPRILDNRDCIVLIDSATAGVAPWTRVNDSVMNPPDRTFTIADPPVWIPEIQEYHTPIRYLLYLRELANAGAPSGLHARPALPSGSTGPLVVFPNPAARRVSVRYCLPKPGAVSVGVYDAEGRLVKLLARGPATAGEHQAWWDGAGKTGRAAAAGVYYCRVQGQGFAATRKLVRLD